MFDYALSTDSLSLSQCVYMHVTSVELKMQTFITLLNRPQNTCLRNL